MNRKSYLYLFIGISVFLAAYLYYQKEDRQHSIEKYFATPKVGDIYKIKSDNDEGQSWLVYYKVAEVYSNRLVFYSSKLMSDASADYLLNHYDTSSPVMYSKDELAAIKDGKWDNNIRKNTTLVEIVRRH